MAKYFIIRLRNVFETHKPWSSRFSNSYLKFMGLVLKEGRKEYALIYTQLHSNPEYNADTYRVIER